MKKYNLLTETSQEIEILSEQTTAGKQLYIQGIFAQAEVLNGNRRKYPKQVMEAAVQKYNEQYVSRLRAIGEINHPDRPFPDIAEAAIRITEMKMEGNDVIGKAVVLNTPKGQILRGLLEGGFNLGVSTRGLGSLKEQNGVKTVQSDFLMTAVDVVDNPSAPNAYVNPLYESNTQWMLNESTGVWTPVNDVGATAINEKKILENFEQLLGSQVVAEQKGFSKDQIEKLRSEWSKVNRVDPSSNEYKQLVKYLNGLDQDALKALAGAKIKFVSSLAQNRVK